MPKALSRLLNQICMSWNFFLLPLSGILDCFLFKSSHDVKKDSSSIPLNFCAISFFFLLFFFPFFVFFISLFTVLLRAPLSRQTVESNQWHDLSRQKKIKYFDLARVARELHKQRYPEWKAQTNAKKRKKRKQEPNNGGKNYLHNTVFIHFFLH